MFFNIFFIVIFLHTFIIILIVGDGVNENNKEQVLDIFSPKISASEIGMHEKGFRKLHLNHLITKLRYLFNYIITINSTFRKSSNIEIQNIKSITYKPYRQ